MHSERKVSRWRVGESESERESSPDQNLVSLGRSVTPPVVGLIGTRCRQAASERIILAADSDRKEDRRAPLASAINHISPAIEQCRSCAQYNLPDDVTTTRRATRPPTLTSPVTPSPTRLGVTRVKPLTCISWRPRRVSHPTSDENKSASLAWRRL